MTRSAAINKSYVLKQAFAALLATAAALVLPQIFHGIGVFTGTGSSLGERFLPMHIPVFAAGLLAGPLAGILAGAASPLISHAVSGMPSAAMLPNITVELAVYGLASGLLYRTEIPSFAKLVIAQTAGRIFKAAVIILAVYGFGSESVHAPVIWKSVINGIPGILLQWILVPALILIVRNRKKSDE